MSGKLREQSLLVNVLWSCTFLSFSGRREIIYSGRIEGRDVKV